MMNHIVCYIQHYTPEANPYDTLGVPRTAGLREAGQRGRKRSVTKQSALFVSCASMCCHQTAPIVASSLTAPVLHRCFLQVKVLHAQKGHADIRSNVVYRRVIFGRGV